MGKRKPKVEISARLYHAVLAVWNDIATDVPEAERWSNAAAIETCVDANRLKLFGHEAAEAEYVELVRVHGLDAVRRALEQEVSLT